jgi:alpha-1,6-mannosyltransferase
VRSFALEGGSPVLKMLDVTEFYSERGGGVRSHLTLKGHVLCQLGHEHVVVAPGPHDSEDAPLARASSGATPRVIRVRGPASPYDPTYHLLLNTRKIREIVARERPDVLEVHSPYMAALGALRAPTGAVRTFQWHSDFIDTYGGVLASALPRVPHGAIRIATSPLWSLVRAIARRSAATLVASKWQVRKLEAHGVPNVVHRPFGIEKDIFQPSRRDEALRASLLEGRDPRTVILAAVGRFAIEKRWDVVIDAFHVVRRERPAVLVFFGDGPERGRMEVRAAGADVRFEGFTKSRVDLARALASADALVHGCPFETFGLSIAEAMSAGLPAVVPDDGGAAEMHDPESGEIYRAGDAEACARAVLRLLARDRASVRDAAVRAAGKLPSVREQFEAQVAFYGELSKRRLC